LVISSLSDDPAQLIDGGQIQCIAFFRPVNGDSTFSRFD
jgi:hypothetical protein